MKALLASVHARVYEWSLEIEQRLSAQMQAAQAPSYDSVDNDEDYDRTINILHNTSVMIERAVNTYQSMLEEDLRQVFLTALNTHYADRVTGESVNVNGKTDIMITGEGGIQFIAECKVWKGQKSLADAIDQVLSYLTWKETRVAILLFHHGMQISTVLKAIPTVLANHPRWKKTLFEDSRKRASFRYVFKHPHDADIDVMLSILVVNLPRNSDVN